MSNKNDRWSQLSMQQRADFFKKAIELGINDRKNIIDIYNKYSNGGRVLDDKTKENQLSDNLIELPGVVVTPNGNYIKYSENNQNVSLQDYTNARIQEDRVKAVNNILNQEHPVVPELPNWFGRQLSSRIGLISENTAMKCFGKMKNPHTCIYTTTSMFPEGSQVSGNKTFAENPKKYGFKEVNTPQIGDMLQLLDNKENPYHAVLVTGLTENGIPIITYSNGGIDRDDNKNGVIDESERHMRYNKNNLYDDNDSNTPDFGIINEDEYNIFRFVGNETQRKKYLEEYEKMYKK